MGSYYLLLLTGCFLHCNFVKTLTLQAFLYKQHFYKEHQAEIGKKLSKS